jgi:glycosyltransferase involved in cell wall biosynthesis
MWFAFLLRGDVREHAATDDPIAQREFVAWWFLHGRNEFPRVWHWDHAAAEVAMELLPANSGSVALPRLLHRLRASRADLGTAFPTADPEAAAELLCWYRLSGPHELPAAPSLPHEIMLETERPSPRAPWDLGPPVPRMAVALWARHNRLQTAFPAGTAQARAGLAAWYVTEGRRLIPLPSVPCSPPGRSAREQLDPFGINLVGFARSEFGLGEDVRMMSAALDAAHVPHVAIDVPVGPLVGREDHSLKAHLAEGLVYDATVFCMTAFDTAHLYLSGRTDLFYAAWNVGYWPWEFPVFPPSWVPVYDLVDEIWAASRFTYSAHVEACLHRPVRLMPPAVTLPPVQSGTRAGFALPPKEVFLFAFPFDPNSFLARKNPMAVVRAFCLAFPDQADRSVGLLLRVNGILPSDSEGEALRRAIQADPRVIVQEGTRTRAEALGILGCCNCLVSLHRSEGFGRNIAEAILLGVPVIATGYSGCADFLRPPESVRWTLQNVQSGDYPFAEGLCWADPCVAHAAQMMCTRRAESQEVSRAQTTQRRAVFRRRYAPAAVGARHAAWLTARLAALTASALKAPLLKAPCAKGR